MMHEMISKNTFLFNFLFINESWKMYHGFHRNYYAAQLFSTDNN